MINRKLTLGLRSSGAVRLKAAVAQLNANSQMDLIKQKEAFLYQQGTEIWDLETSLRHSVGAQRENSCCWSPQKL